MDPLFCELEFDTWGTGAAHAALWSMPIAEVCDRCHGQKLLGPRTFPVTCPQCHGTGTTRRPEVQHGS